MTVKEARRGKKEEKGRREARGGQSQVLGMVGERC